MAGATAAHKHTLTFMLKLCLCFKSTTCKCITSGRNMLGDVVREFSYEKNNTSRMLQHYRISDPIKAAIITLD